MTKVVALISSGRYRQEHYEDVAQILSSFTLRTGRKEWTFDTDMDTGTLMREVAAFAPKSRPVTHKQGS